MWNCYLKLSICSYGYNHVRLDNKLIVAGFVVKEFSENTPARIKLLKSNRNITMMAELDEIRSIVDNVNKKAAVEISQEKERVLDE